MDERALLSCSVIAVDVLPSFVFESFIYSTFACIYSLITRDPNAAVASLLLNASSSFSAFFSAILSYSLVSSFFGSLSFPGRVSEKAKTASFSSCSDFA